MAAALLGGLGFAGQGQAATFSSCVGTGYDISGNVSGATGCTIGSQPQDFTNTNPITVNEPPGFFGLTDWVYIDRDDPPVGGDQSGTYDFGAAFGSYTTVMLIFKSGNDNSGATLVGYTVNTQSGTWRTPFVDPPFNFPGNSTIKDVSHISYYGSMSGPDPNPPIPEPMSLALFGLGLAGLGVARRRRKAA
ncbi:PEP-CTERM sorting domain-containing protein [Falsiroseomonas bella]|uniref:PEP-CTERM sorting domain-containing protein n=2 Tax=Falsiroseomonas bella TaxID=2184016 RepID=A0A317FNL8_9PROT|nr:PEP-CTERM sorting domain-containing protein [Falsiroseomonas bella]